MKQYIIVLLTCMCLGGNCVMAQNVVVDEILAVVGNIYRELNVNGIFIFVLNGLEYAPHALGYLFVFDESFAGDETHIAISSHFTLSALGIEIMLDQDIFEIIRYKRFDNARGKPFEATL